MGSSVFHGGFSTFLAISTLSVAKSYIFEVFFKCWFGIILFGMANGFLLLPVILSFAGPTDDLLGHNNSDTSDGSTRDASHNPKMTCSDLKGSSDPEASDSSSKKLKSEMELEV